MRSLKRRLEALHAQAMSVVMQLEALIAETGEESPGGCLHPLEKRRRTQTLADAQPKYRCDGCGEEVT